VLTQAEKGWSIYSQPLINKCLSEGENLQTSEKPVNELCLLTYDPYYQCRPRP